LGPRANRWNYLMRNKSTAECRHILASVLALAILAMVVPVDNASAEVFGECAHQRNLDIKIASCIEASRSTSYPWILHWVYRALARAQRERGEIQAAITSYEKSLAAEERPWVRQEMEDLAGLTQ